MDNLTNRVIKGYELRELIGSGGFGAVYRAYQTQVEREVALKIILPNYANHPDFIRRFEAEAQMIARLEHFHIVPLYDFWREPDGAFLVMRWLRGGSLRTLIDQGPLAVPVIARLLDQVAAALATAHRHGVIHRDIKPDNILLDEEGNAFLVDFGIAVDLLKPDTPQQHESFGSPAYASPEHIMGYTFTPQMDIYSLGIVLYEMLTGVRPFASDDHMVLMRQHLSDPIPPLQTHRPDLPPALNTVIWRATAKSPQARYPNVLELAADFRRALDLSDNAASPVVAPATPRMSDTVLETIMLVGGADPINPYKGLRPFQEADAADFFGREKLVEHLLMRLAAIEPRSEDAPLEETGRLLEGESGPRFLAVVGPSGSGKSSVVKAGLIPALRRGALPGSADWFVAQMTPGSSPFEELAAALLRIAANAPPNLLERLRKDERGLLQVASEVLPADSSELLLVIDQFEELFTLVEDEAERRSFLNSLLAAVEDPASRLRVVITLRADFYDRPLLYSGFADLVRDHTEVVLPMSSSELAQAINGPAERAALLLETGLASAIVGDVSKQPGALPLLQFALTELFERREGRSLTLAAYQAIGGVSGALARRADELYDSLDVVSKAAARQMLLRLVTLGESTDDTRRRVLQSELLSAGANRKIMQEVIDTFGKYRLLTFDREPNTRVQTVELAHEALIREWKLLRTWLDASRDELRLHQRLATATTEWLNQGRDSSYLASGSRLSQFEPLLESRTLPLNEDERAYLEASIEQRQRAQNRLRMFIAGLAVVAIVSVSLALFAIYAANVADVEKRRSDSRALAAIANTNRDQVDLSLLLSLEALNTFDTFEARSNLLRELQHRPRLAQFFHGHTDEARTAVYSPDGTLLASGSRDNTIILWDVATGKPVFPPLRGHTDYVNSLAFSPDGQTLVSGSADGTLRLWDVATGEPIGEPLEGHTDGVWSVAFSPDGELIASGSDDMTVRLWDAATGEPVGEPLEGHTDYVSAVVFSPDGETLVSGSYDTTIRLWDVATGEPVGAPLEGHTNAVLTLAFNTRGLLASSGMEEYDENNNPVYWIILWNSSGEELFRIATEHTDYVRSLAFHPERDVLASASEDGTIQRWDPLSALPIGEPLVGHLDGVWDVEYSPDGQSLISAGEDGALIRWDVRPEYEPLGLRLTGHTETIASVAFSPDGTLLASGSGDPSIGEDNTVRLWDAATGEELAVLEGHAGPVTSVAFSPDGRYLASSSADASVILWDVETRRQAAQLTRPSGVIWSAAFSPDSTMMASGGDDNLVILWDVGTRTMIGRPLEGHTDWISSVVFSPDGETLASASRDGTIILWDANTGQPLAEPLKGHTDQVMSVVFSPDGETLASASRDGTIILWDVTTRQPIGQPLTGHEGYVLSVAFSPDGRLLASGGELDEAAILWDSETRIALGQPFLGHEDWVNSVAFSPDGRTLASASRDATIILWDVSLESWRERACAIANRNLTMNEWERYLPGVAYRETCPS
jgi:WD40 repeat protein/serine/threonine protein kinase